jgi:hypothetical protein
VQEEEQEGNFVSAIPDAVKKKARQASDGGIAIQELLARVCGILAPAAAFDDDSRAAYQQMFLQAPLATSAVQALEPWSNR